MQISHETIKTFDGLTDEEARAFSLRRLEPLHLEIQPILTSVMNMIRVGDLQASSSRARILSERLVDRSIGPCPTAFPDPRFLLEHTVAGWTATLLTEELVLTAAHAIDAASLETSNLQGYRLVFRNLEHDLQLQPPEVSTEEILVPEEVVAFENEAELQGRDWALIRVEPHGHASRSLAANRGLLRTKGMPEAGESVWYAGHPAGLPLKAEQGRVPVPKGVLRPPSGVFGASMDVIGGSSGSPVFDSKARLAGVLRGYSKHWLSTPERRCKVPTYMANAAQSITSVERILEILRIKKPMEHEKLMKSFQR